MLKNGTDWLTEQLDRFVAQTVTYKSPSAALSVRAVPGKSEFEADGGEGATVRFETADFIFAADALPFRPSRGDVIVFAGSEYDVISPAGEPEWRWTGIYKTAIRVHTKRRTRNGQ